MKICLSLFLCLLVTSPLYAGKIVIEVPERLDARVETALCATGGFTDIEGDGLDDNTFLTRSEFAHNQISEYIRRIVINYEINTAVNVKRQQEHDKASSEIELLVTSVEIK